MATKIDSFFFKDNPESVTVHNCQTVHDNQYSNLNLNQNLKCLNVSPIHSKSYNNKNCGTAATLKLPGFSVSGNTEGRENPLHLNKPSKISDFSNLIYDKIEKEKFKKQWKTNSYSNTINSSTISFHISAYENSAKTDSFNGCKNRNLQKGKIDSIKNEKQLFTSGTFFIPNTFQFPRQENEGENVPEVSKFKASQQLFNSNKAPDKRDAKRIGKKAKHNLPKFPPSSEFPDDVLKYMMKNANAKQIIKLMNICKYFIPKKCPFIYFGNEYRDGSLFLDENSLSFYAPLLMEYKLKDLPYNLGISGKLYVFDGKALPKLISKIIVCEIKRLYLCTPRISYSAYKFLTASGKLKELDLKNAVVTLKTGYIVPYETLLENTPNLRVLEITYDPQKPLSKKLVDKICELNLEKLVLNGLTDAFKLESFMAVIAKKKPNLDIRLRFVYSFKTRRNIYLYMDKLIGAGLPASFPPYFEFCYDSLYYARLKAYANLQKAYRQRNLNLF